VDSEEVEQSPSVDEEEDDNDDELEDEGEEFRADFLFAFLEGFFLLFLEEGFFGSLSSSLELELSGSPSPPSPEPALDAVDLLSSFNQALASSKLSKISTKFHPCWHKRSRSMVDTATLRALSLRS
jgi:hypothetical protein